MYPIISQAYPLYYNTKMRIITHLIYIPKCHINLRKKTTMLKLKSSFQHDLKQYEAICQPYGMELNVLHEIIKPYIYAKH